MALTDAEIALLNKTANAVKYMPIIYKEVLITDSQDPNNHYIKHKVGDIGFSDLLFFVPQQIPAEGTNVQYIKLLQPGEGYDITSANIKTYTIKIEVGLDEEPWTQFVDCQRIHLKPQRLYMLRKYSETELIVVNFRYDDALIGNTLTFAQGHFTSAPTTTVDGSSVTLVNTNDFNALVTRVSALEGLIKVGTQDAATALAEEDEGTIYVRVEDNGGE